MKNKEEEDEEEEEEEGRTPNKWGSLLCFVTRNFSI
jgi:hypothetical protein